MTQDERWQGIAIYGLYLLALFTAVPFFIGVVLAYVFRSSGSPAIQTHFEHQIGLFWRFFLGNVLNAVLASAGMALAIVIIGLPMLLVAAAIFIWLWVMMLTRCIRGIGRLNTGEAYPIPAGFSL
ncbi:MAG: hypothetical protein AAFR65_09005 [Pseudomonadota bacterium]